MVKKIAMLGLCTSLVLSSQGQHILTANAPMTKDAAKGMYTGSYVLDNDHILICYETSNGTAYGYEFSDNAQFVKEYQGEEFNALIARIKSTESVQVHNAKEVNSLDVMYTSRNFGGGLVLRTATLYLNSDKKFIHGFELQEKDKKKLKAQDTWKTIEVGSHAIIPDNLRQVKFQAKNGRHMLFNFDKSESLVIAPMQGAIQTAGIIVEKVNIRQPSPYNMNRLAIYTISGNDQKESSEIHIMPYAMQSVGVGRSAKGNFLAMTMPVQGFSTVKAQNKLFAPSEDRNNLYIFEIDKDNKVIHETVFKSPMMEVNYQALPAGNKTLLIGTGSEGRNWRAAYAGQKMTGLALAFLDDQGKITSSHSYSGKDFMNKTEEAGTGKNKLSMKFTGGPDFYRAEVLENGNYFILGSSHGYHHGILMSAKGELIKYYIFPHADLEKHIPFTNQLEIRGNQIYFVKTDQPNSLSNQVQSKTSSSSSTSYMAGGYALKTTTTTTTTKQRFEIYHISQVFSIDGTNGNCSQLWLQDHYKNFHTLGNFPAIFTEKGIYFSGRVKADKGKEIGLVKMNYSTP